MLTSVINKRKTPRPTMDPKHFLNRELGSLAFNDRVLDLVEEPNTPLLERLRFLSIADTILDEFFEIRVAGLKEQMRYGTASLSPDGLTPQETFKLLLPRARAVVERMYRLLNEVVLPALEAQHIRFLRRVEWRDEQRAWIKAYFLREVMPVLTPIGLDPAHPFPRLLNKSLNFAIALTGKDAFGRNSGTAVLQAPRALPRLVKLPDTLSRAPAITLFFSRQTYCQ